MIKYFKSKGTNILFTIVMSAMIIGLTGCDKTKADNSTFNQNTNNNQNATMTADETTTELDDTTAIVDETTILPEGVIPTSDEDQPIFYGDWIISKVQAAGVGTYSEDDVKVLIGKTLSYSADRASYFGDDTSYVDKVTTPIYTEVLYTEIEFVEFYRIPTDLLGLDRDEITVINVTDADGHVSTLILKDKDTMLVSGGGTYFELTRNIKE